MRFALLVGATMLCVLAAGLLTSASYIALRFFHATSLVPLLRIAAVTGMATGIRQILVFGTQAFKSVRDATVVRGILQPATRLVAVVVAFTISRSTAAALAGLLIAEIRLALIAAGLAAYRPLLARVSVPAREERAHPSTPP
jgi:hypothetical protein